MVTVVGRYLTSDRTFVGSGPGSAYCGRSFDAASWVSGGLEHTVMIG